MTFEKHLRSVSRAALQRLGILRKEYLNVLQCFTLFCSFCTRGALVAHRYTYAPPRCRTLQYCRTFVPLSVSLCNDLADPMFDGVGHGTCSAVWDWLVSRAGPLIIIIKKGWQARLGESDIHPISAKTPAPQYQPIDRKKRKGKRVDDYSRERVA